MADDSPTAESEAPASEKPGIWRRWLIDPVIGQLKQGTSPDKMAWTIGAGVGLGICPLLGTRGWLCLLAGWWFKLNQPVIHAFKSLAYPAHLALIIPFIHLGQWIYREPPLRLTIGTIRVRVEADAMGFLHDFGWVVLRATSAWLLVAPLVIVILKFVLTPVLRKAGLRGKSEGEKAEL